MVDDQESQLWKDQQMREELTTVVGQAASDVLAFHPHKPHQTKSLFVYSLSETVSAESLTRLFSQSYPLKHATVVRDPLTKKSKGYGFVTFADSEDASKARESFNGFLFEGRKLKIKPAEPRHRGSHSTEKFTATSATPAAITKPDEERQKKTNQNSSKLIIRNLPWKINEPEQLAALFRSYGKVIYATLPKKRPGRSAGFGFITLRGRKKAEKALQGMNGKEIEGRTLAVDWAVEKELWESAQSHVLKSNSEIPEVGEATVMVQEVNGVEDAKSEGDCIIDCSNSEDDPMSEVHEDIEAHSEKSSLVAWSDTEQGSRQQQKDPQMCTCFVRNLPFNTTDMILYEHFRIFGPLRYARVVLDPLTERSRGTGFVCFSRAADADVCLRESPRPQSAPVRSNTSSLSNAFPQMKQSLLEDLEADPSGRYSLDGRVLQVSRAVDKKEAIRLTTIGNSLRTLQDTDKRRLYLLSEGTIPSNAPLYEQLAPSEIKLREDSARQRQSLIKSNPSLHLSLTRLSVRNLPRSITSKSLKALARDAVVGFAKDVKAGRRKKLSKEELLRGGYELRDAEKSRKVRGKGIVKQAKVVFEGREGNKVLESSGAGRSRGYGFIEYTSHRWALMGLRWLNGYEANELGGEVPVDKRISGKKKRLIVEFAIENAQVVERRQDREAKARERSNLVVQKIEQGQIPATTTKSLSRDSLMARTRKGLKRKREDHENSEVVGSTVPAKRKSDNGVSNDLNDIAIRRRIIGKKRMLRKNRSATWL